MRKSFYQESKTKIDAAFEYLLQFVDNHDAFPYQQKAVWSYYEKTLLKNMNRISRLSGDYTKIKSMEGQIDLNESTIMDLVY